MTPSFDMNPNTQADHALPMVVLIPTHGRPTLLERTIDSVLACHRPADREVRLIVVENGGRHGAEQVLAPKGTWLKPEYRYHDKPNKSEALNSVLAELGDCFIVFFDDDIRVVPEILVHYAGAAGALRGGRFFGGGIKIDYEEPPPDWLLKYLPTSAKGWHPPPDPQASITPRMAFLGFNWAAFSSDLIAAGGFDGRFGPGGLSGGTGQERGMQIALRNAGVVSHYIHDAVVWHYVPRSRCSARWALNREYRGGITLGHEMRVTEGQKTIAGVPRHMVKLAARRMLNVARAWLREGPEARFARMSQLVELLGNIKGLRERERLRITSAAQR
jgi:glycosyltransferase involved in cell wall biosynthesis